MNKPDLQHSLGSIFIADSYIEQPGFQCWLERHEELSLVVQGQHNLEGQSIILADGTQAKRCPLNNENAEKLAQWLPHLTPQMLGKHKSFGFGDRLGQATPGHLGALLLDTGSSIQPILAQQSVRENTRIGRNPKDVINAARWGILEMGYQNPWGADADHVKHQEDVTDFVKAGYTFFTIDPSDHVDNQAEQDTLKVLYDKVNTLPWSTFETTLEELKRDYLQKPIHLQSMKLEFTEADLLKALAKYGRALVHTLELSQHIQSALGKPFDLEMSIDETDTPTSAQEHYFIASELLKRKIPLVSLAPRFVGKFQKGVDYIGTVKDFAQSLAQHAEIMKYFDTYKLSIHTGSDKFSLYPVIAHYCGDSLHVKTAGTSYLEALRVFAKHEPQLFRDILTLSKQAFETDKKSYALDCKPENVPAESQLKDSELPELLEQFDSRQVLHVSFGSVITAYKKRIHETLNHHHLAYKDTLKLHFEKHLQLLKGQV